MPMVLQITRERGFYGRFRKLKLLADGNEVAQIANGETMSVTMPDQSLELTGKMDWVTTYPFDLTQVSHGDKVKIIIASRWWLRPAQTTLWLPFVFQKDT